VLFRSIKGVNDILPDVIGLWQKVESSARKVFSLYGYEEIRTPIFEQTELFARSIGQTSDIVKKEMYSFTDKKGRAVTLRPEATAPVIRSYIENKEHFRKAITKLYYLGPMFRYERPQKGRSRQFHQIGVEVVGGYSPYTDAEVIEVGYQFFKNIGLGDIVIEINSVGCPECRPRYSKALKTYLEDKIGTFCEDCQDRYQKNILRILDCKVKEDILQLNDAPVVTDHVCEECSEHYKTVQNALNILKVPFTINQKMVRGLDYYTKTVFEIKHGSLGALDAVAAGGRYDNLIHELGGEKKGAVGFAVGMERIILALTERLETGIDTYNLDAYLVSLGDESFKQNFILQDRLRKAGLRIDISYDAKSIKAQMKQADLSKARYTLIRGDNELADNVITVRDMKSGDEKKIKVDDIESWFARNSQRISAVET